MVFVAGVISGINHAANTTNFHQVPIGSWTLAWIWAVFVTFFQGSMPLALAIIGVFAAGVLLDRLERP
jgi:hypothetical protein